MQFGTTTDDGHHGRVPTDVVTQQIFGNALAAIADEMANTIYRTAYSTVVRDVMDFSTALCDPDGQIIAQAVTVPFHLGSIPTAIESLLGHFRGELRDGDVFVLNDPFDGGMHLPDIFLARPIVVDGQLTAIAVAVAHHADVGGRLPGSSASDNTDVFQEGIRIPWIRLYDRCARVEDVFTIIRANVRVPRDTLGDINAQHAACILAERELRELAGRYGVELMARLMAEIIDHTERLVRQEIGSWPDGVASFTDYLDSDGLAPNSVKISCRVEIAGDTVVVDFSESADMVPGALNSTRSFVVAAVYSAVRSALTVDVPYTAGAFRPITVITRPGTVTHVTFPGASSMRGVTGFRAYDAVNGALAQLIPDRVPAAGEGGNTLAVFGGRADDGETFVYYELVAGTWGATCRSDGNDGVMNPNSTGSNIPVEFAEAEYPMIVESYGLVPDTGGPGRHRGGLAIERSWRPTVDVSLLVRSDRQRTAPYGLAGGKPGANSQNVIDEPGRSAVRLDTMASTRLSAGTLFRHMTAGGGGWGNPLLRDPRAVADDVSDGKISLERARVDYAVVFDETGAVDELATASLRARVSARLPDAPEAEEFW